MRNCGDAVTNCTLQLITHDFVKITVAYLFKRTTVMLRKFRDFESNLEKAVSLDCFMDDVRNPVVVRLNCIKCMEIVQLKFSRFGSTIKNYDLFTSIYFFKS